MNDFEIGDEVRYVESDRTFVIIRVERNGLICGFNEKGDAFIDKSPLRWMKTGRHFPEVADLLRKMGGPTP